MINFEKLAEEQLPHMRGGEGTVKARRFSDDKVKIMRLTLEKGCSIGLHRHETSSEALFVLSGKANFVLDGSEETLEEGQCHYCPKGSEHTVCNREARPLVLLAVVTEME